MSEPRVIKRYANRKLYDTERSRYVTLNQIANMVRAGQDLRIVDNTTKEDLTSVTLAQIIFEQEKKQNAFPPLGTMKNIIQTSGASLSELSARVRQVLGLPGGPHAEPPPDGDPSVLSDDEPPHGALPVQLVREFLERSQQTFDEWQKRVDERVQKVVEALAPWTVLEKEVEELQQRIVELEKKLADSERARLALSHAAD